MANLMWQENLSALRWSVRLNRAVPKAYREWMRGNSHSHSFTEVVVCLAGDHLYGVNGDGRNLSPGEVLIIPPGVRHDSGYSAHHSACTDLWFHFLTPAHVSVNIIEHSPSSRLVFRHVCFAEPAINQDLQRACVLFSSAPLPDPPHAGKVGSFLLFLLQEILENLTVYGLRDQRTSGNVVIPHIKEYITHNLGERLKLSDLARVAGFSPFHFHREFRRIESTTPRNFIETERLKNACDLLQRGRSVTSAAFDSGFTTCPQFNRTFKKHFGVAPVAWLKGRSL